MARRRETFAKRFFQYFWFGLWLGLWVLFGLSFWSRCRRSSRLQPAGFCPYDGMSLPNEPNPYTCSVSSIASSMRRAREMVWLSCAATIVKHARRVSLLAAAATAVAANIHWWCRAAIVTSLSPASVHGCSGCGTQQSGEIADIAVWRHRALSVKTLRAWGRFTCIP